MQKIENAPGICAEIDTVAKANKLPAKTRVDFSQRNRLNELNNNIISGTSFESVNRSA